MNRFEKREREDTNANTRNESGDIATNPTDIKGVTKKQVHVNIIKNLSEMTNSLKSPIYQNEHK